ncbi:heme a biosynthesis protein-like protein [Calycina marina]|uniref:Protoheme IX farnesyltransferase, mitochondrial n=1 Tax=Calycina marina TaxID=1763456 RepID=A0A9P8CKY6_9HELO|nr:heme a biosynthesis protein-like protein [Calycina marina]
MFEFWNYPGLQAMIVRCSPRGSLPIDSLSTICRACFRQSIKPATRESRRQYSRTAKSKTAVFLSRGKFQETYFSSNSRILISKTAREDVHWSVGKDGRRQAPTESTRSVDSTKVLEDPAVLKELPHRRRQREKKEAAETDLVLPPNASTTLAQEAEAAPSNSLRRLFPVLLSLSKPRLSALVVLTACASYSLYPVPELLSPSATDAPSLNTLTLLFLTSGTALCAASANTFNMLYEPKWDAMMSRTRNRPLVRRLISKRGAAIFGVLSGVAGTGLLYYGVNPTVSFLGALNIGLYAAVYTPLKRVHVVNTWVGAVVGGIPPLMGWAAGAGMSATDGGWQELLLGEHNIGGWLLGGLLVAWQLSHFMSLSWSIRNEYKQAGYKMLCWVNPAMNGRVALRYSIAVIPLCVGLCYTGVTEWSFAVASAPVNLWMVQQAYKFWKYEGAKGSAKGLFWASVWHLPVVLVLALLEKKGMWQRAWRAAIGEASLDDDDWLEEDEEDIVVPTKHLGPSCHQNDGPDKIHMEATNV